MSENNRWLPIESAPKDGTRVLLYFKNGFAVTFGQYGDYRFQNDHLKGWYFFDAEDPWCSADFAPYEPAHWQPLPQPPQAEGGA